MERLPIRAPHAKVFPFGLLHHNHSGLLETQSPHLGICSIDQLTTRADYSKCDDVHLTPGDELQPRKPLLHSQKFHLSVSCSVQVVTVYPKLITRPTSSLHYSKVNLFSSLSPMKDQLLPVHPNFKNFSLLPLS